MTTNHDCFQFALNLSVAVMPLFSACLSRNTMMPMSNNITNRHSDLFILGYTKLPMRPDKRPSLKDILLMTVDDLVDFVETSGIYNLRHPGTHEVLRKIWRRLVQIVEKMGFLLNAIEDSDGTIVLHPSTRRALLPLGIIFMVSRSTLPYTVRNRSFPGYAWICSRMCICGVAFVFIFASFVTHNLKI